MLYPLASAPFVVQVASTVMDNSPAFKIAAESVLNMYFESFDSTSVPS